MTMNIEYFHKTQFVNFFNSVANKKVAVMYDINTQPFAENIKKQL